MRLELVGSDAPIWPTYEINHTFALLYQLNLFFTKVGVGPTAFHFFCCEQIRRGASELEYPLIKDGEIAPSWSVQKKQKEKTKQ